MTKYETIMARKQHFLVLRGQRMLHALDFKTSGTHECAVNGAPKSLDVERHLYHYTPHGSLG